MLHSDFLKEHGRETLSHPGAGRIVKNLVFHLGLEDRLTKGIRRLAEGRKEHSKQRMLQNKASLRSYKLMGRRSKDMAKLLERKTYPSTYKQLYLEREHGVTFEQAQSKPLKAYSIVILSLEHQNSGKTIGTDPQIHFTLIQY